MILRPTPAGAYVVVGSCHVAGFSPAESLLGPVSKPWNLQFAMDEAAFYLPSFHNALTGENTAQDPRLPPLSPE